MQVRPAFGMGLSAGFEPVPKLVGWVAVGLPSPNNPGPRSSHVLSAHLRLPLRQGQDGDGQGRPPSLVITHMLREAQIWRLGLHSGRQIWECRGTSDWAKRTCG